LTNWPTDTAVHLITYQKKTDGTMDRDTLCLWKGIVSGTTIGTLTLKGGTDAGNSVGDFVEMAPTSTYAQDLYDGLTQEHNTDGTHGDITTSSITSTGDAEATGFTVTGKTTGILGDEVIFTSSGTWTKDANLKFVVVEVQGGGGGGGAAGSSTGQNGSGGGGGGYAMKKIAAASLGATETVTVGAAGAAGTGGSVDGGNGGDSSFGAHCTGAGGAKGLHGSTSSAFSGGAGGAGTGGDVNITGQEGGAGGVNGSADNGVNRRLGNGGSSKWGFGAVTNAPSSSSGKNATGYGGGGSAASRLSSNQDGGAGTAGLVIVREYY
jgi:hypothetical protein